MASIIDTLKFKYKTGNILFKLIFINIAVFLLLRICAIIFTFGAWNFDAIILQWVEMPSDPVLLLTRPWTIITYMFAQFDILHILFNMLWLYWFGSIFLFAGNTRQMLTLYLYGGISGALIYLAAYNLFPYFSGVNSWLIGSSASVLAIVAGTAMRHPDYKTHLLFLGEVSLKWIAILIIVIDFLSLTETNAGGHIAHIGGVAAGALWGYMLKRGTDITRPLSKAFDYIASTWHRLTAPRPKSSASSRHNEKTGKATADDIKNLDEILDKIRKSGYTSLTAEEKARLFDVSRRIK